MAALTQEEIRQQKQEIDEERQRFSSRLLRLIKPG